MVGDLEKTDFDFVHPIKNAKGKKISNLQGFRARFQTFLKLSTFLKMFTKICQAASKRGEKILIENVLSFFVVWLQFDRKNSLFNILNPGQRQTTGTSSLYIIYERPKRTIPTFLRKRLNRCGRSWF